MSTSLQPSSNLTSLIFNGRDAANNKQTRGKRSLLHANRQEDYRMQHQYASSENRNPVIDLLKPPQHFSGFDSKKIETGYNKAIFAILFLLQNTLLRFFDGGKSNNISALCDK